MNTELANYHRYTGVHDAGQAKHYVLTSLERLDVLLGNMETLGKPGYEPQAVRAVARESLSYQLKAAQKDLSKALELLKHISDVDVTL